MPQINTTDTLPTDKSGNRPPKVSMNIYTPNFDNKLYSNLKRLTFFINYEPKMRFLELNKQLENGSFGASWKMGLPYSYLTTLGGRSLRGYMVYVDALG